MMPTNRSRQPSGACSAVIAGSLLTLVSATLGGCGVTVGAGGSHRGGDTISVGTLIEPNTLNPVIGTIVVESRADNLLYDGLVRIDDRGQPVADLAKVVPSMANGGISADGKTVTYHLVENARWQDGQPVVADDVVFTYQAIMNPRNNVGSRALYEHIDHVEAVDAHTVRVHFKEPFAPAVFLFADENQGSIVPKHLLASYPDINKVAFNVAPVGSGPYRLAEWRHGDRLIFEANPTYFRGAPKIKRIDLKVLPDTNTELTQLRTHEIDSTVDLDPNQVAILHGFAGVATTIVSTNGYRHVSFNTRRPPLDDVRVRRALCYAMDPDALFRKIYFSIGLRAPADQNPGGGWADPSLRYYPHDPKRAGDLLDAAGWRLGPEGIRVKAGRPLSIGLVSVAGAKANEAVEVAVQAAWRGVGVETTIKNFPGTTLFAPAGSGGVILGGKFDTAVFSLYRDPDPNDMAVMGPYGVPPNGLNSSFFADPEMGRLQTEGIRTFDTARRHRLYDAIQRIIVSNVPIYTFLWVPLIDAHSERIHGIKPDPLGIDFWNITDWTVAGG